MSPVNAIAEERRKGRSLDMLSCPNPKCDYTTNCVLKDIENSSFICPKCDKWYTGKYVLKKDREFHLACQVIHEPDKFTYREKQILIYHYGLNGKSETTLSYLAKMFKVTVERIRQIKYKALWKAQQIYMEYRE